ncbi:PTS system cellobiose-specific transporter subunit IIC [Lactobacillus selangorensis]|uniref:Permease IIC component n=1 Tax=Lactobacillus selangorensis TaxID=81857 RepID=A0A0R2FPQ1_9LACO|nr:PTS transporter subunit EIIC [Lactobacillus selangorensis]KRN28014.1 PTS system cellobiose-specific transporter subunit IIC [Lactobacillus selangorensis]KRN30515.1 PTS system cellobiose-specific transporter subunit IIC [Lactobacillus selangorensis]
MEAVEQRIAKWFLHISFLLKRQRLYRAAQQTLVIIFPFALVGSFMKAIDAACFMPDGFLAEIYGFDTTNTFFTEAHSVLQAFSNLTLGLVAMMTAYYASKYVARSYQKDDQLAGFTSLCVFLIFNYQLSARTNHIRVNNLGMRGMLLAMITGLIVGWLFNLLWTKKAVYTWERPLHLIMERCLSSIWAILILISGALLINVGFSFLTPGASDNGGLNGLIYMVFRLPAHSSSALLQILGLTGINNFLNTIGVEGPFSALTPSTNSTYDTQNLNYALSHKTAYNVPHPLTLHTTFDTFANFGGNGMTLALIIAILILHHSSDQGKIAKWSLLPGLFNINTPLMFGIPLLFNPLLAIPFIIAPWVNILIASIFLKLRWMPAAIYPVPGTTPGPLSAFLGTNGNWVALFVSLLCLAVSVLIYLPFIKINNEAIRLASKEGEQK